MRRRKIRTERLSPDPLARSKYVIVPVLPNTENIETNLNFIEELKEYKPQISNESTEKPLLRCGECGGIDFLRTGTCHVCRTCGASQGCS